jgi:hypothetical protein
MPSTTLAICPSERCWLRTTCTPRAPFSAHRCLLCGTAGFANFLVVRDPRLLLVSEIGIGIAWASIVALPYAILASGLAQAKLRIYMGFSTYSSSSPNCPSRR